MWLRKSHQIAVWKVGEEKLHKPGWCVLPVWIGTLESGINVAPWINIGPGKLAKRISVAPFIPYTYTTKIGSMET